MKWLLFLGLLLVFLVGCGLQPIVPAQPTPVQLELPTSTTQLVLTQEDLDQLGIEPNITCQTEEQVDEQLASVQYTFCSYILDGENRTQLFVELKKFSSVDAVTNAYQYDSSHYFAADGLLSENTYGDMSRFRVNSENDYGAQYNPPGVYFYHLWFVKDTYLVHITSSGSQKAKNIIAQMGELFLAKLNGETIEPAQLANPASVYCEEQGGTLRMEENEAGQYGICMLPDGTECEEWAYFRGECVIKE